MKSSQFDTKSNRTRDGKKVKYLVETIEDKGMGWALRVWREGAAIGEDAILWNTGNADVTSPPEDFLKWQGDSWVQIVWITTGKKNFARIREISWKMTDSCYTPWNIGGVRSAKDSDESADGESDDNPNEQE